MPPRSCSACGVSISDDDYLMSSLQRGEPFCSPCLDSQRLEMAEVRSSASTGRTAPSQSLRMLDPEVRADYIVKLSKGQLGLWNLGALLVGVAGGFLLQNAVFGVCIGLTAWAGKSLASSLRRTEFAELDDEQLVKRFQLMRKSAGRSGHLLPKSALVLVLLLGVFRVLNPTSEQFKEFQPARRGEVERQDYGLASVYAVGDLRKGGRRFLGVLGRFWELPRG